MHPILVRTLRCGLLPALLAAAAAVRAQGSAPRPPGAAPYGIGIIGTGRIGGALARLWVKAGHEVLVSSRHPDQLGALVAELGPRAHAGTPRDAAAFGSIIVLAVPYAAVPQLGSDLRAELAGKVIIDAGNPVENRDGAMALDAQKKGAGLATAGYLHSSRVVRAFNCIPAAMLATGADRKPERIAIPIGGDDAAALQIVQQLIREIGFDPVVVGSLARSRDFDLFQPLASIALKGPTATELRGKIAP